MCGPYWSQWDRSELDSMLGKDLVEDEEEDVDYDEEEPYEPHDCGNCMECLGMKWRDFM